jgi:hypothetical protein
LPDSSNAPGLIRRTRWLLLADSFLKVPVLPLQFLVGILKLLYIGMCVLSWGIILWVLGEKHIGVLKILILLSSLGVWAGIISTLYSFYY